MPLPVSLWDFHPISAWLWRIACCQASVEPAPDPELGVEAAWDAEIAQRMARYDAGESCAVPAIEVFARLREIAPGH